MWELDYKECRALKNLCFLAVVLEKSLESPLDCKEIQPVHPKGNQSWIFIGRPAAKAETPILWPPDVKNWPIWKHPDAGKDWRQEEKGTTEDETVGWHHWRDGREFEYASGVGDGQGGLACCSQSMGSQRVRHDWPTELTEDLEGEMKSSALAMFAWMLIRHPRANMELAEFRGGVKLGFLWEASALRPGWGHRGSEYRDSTCPWHIAELEEKLREGSLFCFVFHSSKMHQHCVLLNFFFSSTLP